MARGGGERERGNGVEKIRDPLSFGGERNDAGCCTFASMMVQGAWIIGHFLFDISNLALETIDGINGIILGVFQTCQRYSSRGENLNQCGNR